MESSDKPSQRTRLIVPVVLLAAFAGWRWFAAPDDAPQSQSSQSAASIPDLRAVSGLGKPPVTLARPATLAAAPTNLQTADEKAMVAVRARFGAGDYGNALALADRQMTDDTLSANYRDWVRVQLPVLLSSQAWLLLKLGQCEEAVPLFQRTMKLEKLPEASKGLAVCFFKLKSYDDAEAHFESYLKGNGKDSEMKVIFSDLLESQGRYSDAIVLLEDVAKEKELPSGLERGDVDKRLGSMRARARESWRQASHTTEYYKVTYRAEEHEVLIPVVADALDTVLEEFRNQWGLTLPHFPIEVVLYPDESFRDLVSYSPRWASGLYDGRMRIPVTRAFRAGKGLDMFRRILRHEMFHAVIAEQIDRRVLPTWLNEGIAQLVECTGGCAPTGFPPTPGDFLVLDEFVQRYTNLDTAKAELAYKQSLYLVRTLLHWRHESGDQPLRTLLETMNETSPVDSDGILRTLGIDFATLRDHAAVNWQKREDY